MKANIYLISLVLFVMLHHVLRHISQMHCALRSVSLEISLLILSTIDMLVKTKVNRINV